MQSFVIYRRESVQLVCKFNLKTFLKKVSVEFVNLATCFFKLKTSLTTLNFSDFIKEVQQRTWAFWPSNPKVFEKKKLLKDYLAHCIYWVWFSRGFLRNVLLVLLVYDLKKSCTCWEKKNKLEWLWQDVNTQKNGSAMVDTSRMKQSKPKQTKTKQTKAKQTKANTAKQCKVETKQNKIIQSGNKTRQRKTRQSRSK